MMDPAQQKEQFSKAYVHAVATAAGLGTAKPEVDDDSVDLIICARRSDALPRSPRLNLQLKCMAEKVVGARDISYPLKRKNYDDLRHENPFTPCILVVVMVPHEVKDWLTQTDEELILRRCAYWRSLRGAPTKTNESTVRVGVPRSQRLTVPILTEMMKKVDQGGFP